MKKARALSALLLALCLCLTAALAAGGGSDDPLISLSYLEDVFAKTADAAVEGRLDSADQALRQEAAARQNGELPFRDRALSVRLP